VEIDRYICDRRSEADRGNTANRRIPAILDHKTIQDGKTQERRIEGIAIRLYLYQKYDRDEKINYLFDTPR